MRTSLGEQGRKPEKFIEVNQPIPFIYYPVSGNCPTGGSAQWSALATTDGTADTDKNLDVGT